MSTDVVERIEGRIDREVISGVSIKKAGSGFAIVPTTLTEALELAKIMSTARGMIPAHLEGNPGACADVVFQALQWSMNPFALAKMSYIAQRGGTPSYMSQAISAAVNSDKRLKTRLRLEFDGDGEDMRCTVSGLFHGEDEPHEYRSPRIKDIGPKNSPLWKTDPQRQLGYWSQRAWARLYAGDTLMGVYDADEMTPDMLSKDVTPRIDPFAGEGPRVPAIGASGVSSISAAGVNNPDAPPHPTASSEGAVEPRAPAPNLSGATAPAPESTSDLHSGEAGASSSSGAPANTARTAGRTAKEAGLKEDANPYPKGSPQWLRWAEGYAGFAE